jgi:hypothetical protein
MTNKKAIVSLMLVCVVTLALTLSAYALAWGTFNNHTIPANQGDTEVSTVKRDNNATTVKHFTISITGLTNGYTAICAWTETPTGSNYSNPGNQISLATNQNVDYYSTNVPGKGDNVVLNFDNPVYTSTAISTSGTWTPN